MPRHSGSHGVWNQTRQKGGNTSRRSRAVAGTYATKQSRVSPIFDLEDPPLVEAGRHSGSSTGKSSPQKPKPTVKGGSKPVGGKGR